MKGLITLFFHLKPKNKMSVFGMLLVPVLLLGAINAWSEDKHDQEHDHEHEAPEEHAPHHENGDHDEHKDHVDHDEDGHDHGEHGEGNEGEDEHGHAEENSSRIDGDMAQQVGIVTSSANAQELHQTITLYGSLAAAPEQVSHVRARFDGLVKSVQVTLGDRVKTGDVLAEIESNESLKTYQIRAPITGRIVQRHANIGESTQDQILFSVVNLDTVWAELRVYPAQQAAVNEGQSVHVLTADGIVESTVNHVVPALESPYQLARVKLNTSKQNLSPGSMVEARVEVGRIPVSLAVAKDAVQTLGGRQGVFVKTGDEYRFTPLVLGQGDDHFYEVVDGLTSGSEYVSKNSYLIKADIEKSEAEHEH